MNPREGREITLVVDGREVVAPEGTMLVDAAKRGDIEIPVFCYEPKLGDPVGACRMCLVEIEGMPKLQTGCSTPVRDGMVVYTQTDQVKEAQSAVVEFLLVNHPLDCPVCDKGGECPLQDIAMGWGPGRSRFTDPKRHFKKPLPLSPLVAIDRERCILCYRCVRFSQEVSEDAQLQLLERGDRSFVGTYDDRAYVAPFHGNITELCPVGALTNYTYRFRARPWDIEQAGSICTLCPSQCNVSFTVRDEKVARVAARDNEDVDDGWLCDKGRYGFQMLSGPERITTPMLGGGGSLRPAGWAEALEGAAAGLRDAGAGSAALVGDASNEEGYLLAQMMRQGLGSPHVDSRLTGGPTREALVELARPQLGAAVRDIDGADVILVVGTDPLHSAPILDLRVRKAVRRNGARLVVLTDRPTALDGGATAAERYPPGSAGAAVAELASALAEETTDVVAADVLEGADRVVVIWGERVCDGPAGEATARALLGLADRLGLDGAGAGLIGIPDATNGRGLREVGCLPHAGPGLAATGTGLDAPAMRKALEGDELSALMLFGADPVRDAPEAERWRAAVQGAGFVVAFAMFENDSAALADVVFPLESHAEKEGTVTHPDGRIQRVRPSVPAPGDIRPVWQVLAELSTALGHDPGVESAADALAALADAVPFYAGLTPDEIGGRGVRWQERDAAARWPGSDRDEGAPRPAAPATGAVSDGADLLLGTYRDIWSGPVTELNPALRFLQPKQRVELAPADAERLGLSDGDRVRVSLDGTGIEGHVEIRERTRPGAAFMVEATREQNPNALANGAPAMVRIEKAEAQ